MFSVDYIFLLNFTYVFAIITCLGFLVIHVSIIIVIVIAVVVNVNLKSKVI